MLASLRDISALPRRFLGLLRLQPFDCSTAAGRGRERYRRVVLTALSSAGAKIISLVTMLISVPLTLHYLGPERYGMWMTISSVIAMLGFADLGLGLGLMNAIAEAHGKDDRQAAVQYVSSAYFMLTGVAIIILAVFFLIYPYVPWPRLFNVTSPQAVAEAGPAMAAFVVCFALNLPLSLVQKIQLGYQEGFLNNIWESIGKLLGLLGVLLVIYYQGGLVWLILAMAGAPAAAALLNTLFLFIYQRPWLLPSLGHAAISSSSKILKLGILFFILQLAVSLVYSSDNLIAAHILGPEAVTQYSVPMRLFGIFLIISGMLINPLWPAYREAITKGDIFWIKKTIIRSILLSFLIVGVPSAFFVIFGREIIRIWVGNEINPSDLLLIGFYLWFVMSGIGNAFSMFLNAANIIFFQIIIGALFTLVSLAVKILLVKYYGIEGIIWATIIAYFVCSIVPISFYIKYLLSYKYH